MKPLSKLILAIIICGAATAAHANMEPFYKGEWNMTPEQIMALYDTEPVDKSTVNSMETLAYQTTVNAYAITITYYFGKQLPTSSKKRLWYVNCEIDISTMSIPECETMTLELLQYIHDSANTFDYDYMSSITHDINMKERWSFRGGYINNTTAICVSGYKIPGWQLEFNETFALSFFYARMPFASKIAKENIEAIISGIRHERAQTQATNLNN